MKKLSTIREYIAAQTPERRAELKKLYAILKKAAPHSGEKLAWGMPTLTLEGNLLHFAAFKNHQSLFPGTEVVTRFLPRLKKYETTKAAIHFPYGEKLPAGLITAIMKYCVKEKLARKKERAKTSAKGKSKSKKSR